MVGGIGAIGKSPGLQRHGAERQFFQEPEGGKQGLEGRSLLDALAWHGAKPDPNEAWG